MNYIWVCPLRSEARMPLGSTCEARGLGRLMSIHHVHQTRGAYIFIVGLEILHHVIFISSGWHEIKLSAAKTDVAKLPKRASACMDTSKRGVHAHQVTPPPSPGYVPVSEVRREQHGIRLSKRGGWGGENRRGARICSWWGRGWRQGGCVTR